MLISKSAKAECSVLCERAEEIIKSVEGSLEAIVAGIHHQFNCDYDREDLTGSGTTITWFNGFQSLSDLGLIVLECEHGGLGGLLKSRGILDLIAETMEYIIEHYLDFFIVYHDEDSSGVDLALIVEECLGMLQRLGAFGEMYEEYWFDGPQGKLDRMMKKHRAGVREGREETDVMWEGEDEGEDEYQHHGGDDSDGDGNGWKGAWNHMDKDNGNRMEMDVDECH